MANPIIVPITAPGTFSKAVDWASGWPLSWYVEKSASATGSYVVNYTGDDLNDTTWTPIWLADGVAGTAQTSSTSNNYPDYPIRGLQVVFSAVGGSGGWRFVILQPMSAR